MAYTGGVGDYVLNILVIGLLFLGAYALVLRNRKRRQQGVQVGVQVDTDPNIIPPAGCLLLMLILFLSVGVSGYVFDIAVKSYILDMSGIYPRNLIILTNAAYVLACLMIARYYEKLLFQRGLLIGLLMILVSTVLMYLMVTNNLIFSYVGGVETAVVYILHAFGSVFCSLFVIASVAYRWFYGRRYLFIGLFAAALQAAVFVCDISGFAEIDIKRCIYVGISCAVLALIIWILEISGKDWRSRKTREMFETRKESGNLKSKPVWMIMAGMVLLGFTASMMTSVPFNNILSRGEAVPAVLLSINSAGAICGSILFGLLAGKYGLRKTVFSFFMIGVISFCLGSFVAVPAVWYPACFALGISLSMLLLISTSAAMELSGDRYNLYAAGRIESAYYLGAFVSVFCMVIFGI